MLEIDKIIEYILNHKKKIIGIEKRYNVIGAYDTYRLDKNSLEIRIHSANPSPCLTRSGFIYYNEGCTHVEVIKVCKNYSGEKYSEEETSKTISLMYKGHDIQKVIRETIYELEKLREENEKIILHKRVMHFDEAKI